MRHFIAYTATYVIAAMLLAGAGIFGWVRAAQVTFTTESAMLAQYSPSPLPIFRWAELGEAAYERNCANCHLADAQGWDQYPPLTHIDSLFQAPGGRDFLIDLHLYGLSSKRWRAPMPRMGHMQDVELAAVLNYLLSSFGNEKVLAPDAELYIPDDIAARRGAGHTPQQVNETRPDIPLPPRSES